MSVKDILAFNCLRESVPQYRLINRLSKGLENGPYQVVQGKVVHRYPHPLRCCPEGKNISDIPGVYDVYCSPSPPDATTPPVDDAIINPRGKSDTKKEKNNKTLRRGVSTFLPLDDDTASDAFAYAHNVMKVKAPNISCATIAVPDNEQQSTEDLYFYADRIMEVSDPYALHVTITNENYPTNYTSMNRVALCKGWLPCPYEANGAVEEDLLDLPNIPSAVTHSAIGLLSYVIESTEDLDPNIRFAAALYRYQLAARDPNLLPEEYAGQDDLLRSLLVEGHRQRSIAYPNFWNCQTPTDYDHYMERIGRACGAKAFSALAHWVDDCDDMSRTVDVDLAGFTSPLLVHARLMGATLTATTGSVTIKMSGVPKEMAEEICHTLKEQPTGPILTKALETLNEKNIADKDPTSLHPMAIFVSSNSDSKPAFARFSIPDAGFFHQKISVTVLGPGKFHSWHEVAQFSCQIVHMLELLRGELAPEDKFRWWCVDGNYHQLNIAEMVSEKSESSDKWSECVCTFLLDNFSSHFRRTSSSSFMAIDGSAVYMLLFSWGIALKQEALPRIKSYLSNRFGTDVQEKSIILDPSTFQD